MNTKKNNIQGYNIGISRKESYSSVLEPKSEKISVKIPIESNGKFKQKTNQLSSQRTDNLETTVLHLYPKAVTTTE